MAQILQKWEKLNDALDKALMIISAAMIALILVCISLEAVLRNTLGSTRGWMEEFPRLFMVIAVFFMIGPLLRKGMHINTDMVDVLLKGKIKEVCALLVQLSVVAGGIILLWAGIAGVQGYLQMGTVTATEIEIPLWTVYLSVPTGAVVLIEEGAEMAFKTVLTLACKENAGEVAI